MGTFVENVNLIALAINKQLDAVRKVILKGTVPPNDKIGEDGDKYMYYSTESVNFYKEYTKSKGTWVLLFDDAGEWLHADGSVLMHNDYMNDIPNSQHPTTPRVKHDGSVMYKKYVDDADIIVQGNLDTYITNTDHRVLVLENEAAAYHLGVSVQIKHEQNVNPLIVFGSYFVGTENSSNTTDYGLPELQSEGLLDVQVFLNPDGSTYGVYQEFVDVNTSFRWSRKTLQTDGHGWEPWAPSLLEDRLDNLRIDIEKNKSLKLNKTGIDSKAFDSFRLGGNESSFYSEATHNHDARYMNVFGTTPYDISYIPNASQSQYPATVDFVTNQIGNIDFAPYLQRDGSVQMSQLFLDAGISALDGDVVPNKFLKKVEADLELAKFDKAGGTITGVTHMKTGAALHMAQSSGLYIHNTEDTTGALSGRLRGTSTGELQLQYASAHMLNYKVDGNIEFGSTPTSLLDNEIIVRKHLTDAITSGATTIVDSLTSTSTTSALSANQGKVLDGKFSNYLPVSSVVDDLTTGGASVPLSADQGVALKSVVDTNTTSLSNKLESSDLAPYARYAISNTWEAAQIQEVVFTTVNGTYIADVSSSSMTRVTITGSSVVLGAAGSAEGMSGSIHVTIDPGATLSFDSTFRFPDGVAPTLEGASVISYVCYEDGFLIATAVTKIPVTPSVP